ncbi:aquaporin Z [Nocardioides korecus]
MSTTTDTGVEPTTEPTTRTDAPTYPLRARLAAEAFGTLWLVLGGVGAAVLAGDQIGNAGIAAAFGLSVLTAAYAVGHVSGGHFNPAVTVGLAVARRISWREVPAYVVTQLVAALAGAGIVLALAEGKAGYQVSQGLGANGYGAESPGDYAWWVAAVAEVVLTAIFVLAILGATDTPAARGFAPLSIGLTLTLIHLVSIPVDGTSVNPARSFGPALLSGGTALGQLWLFVVFPLVGALSAGAAYSWLFGRRAVASMEEATRA